MNDKGQVIQTLVALIAVILVQSVAYFAGRFFGSDPVEILLLLILFSIWSNTILRNVK